jgi:hypothetical protein
VGPSFLGFLADFGLLALFPFKVFLAGPDSALPGPPVPWFFACRRAFLSWCF